MIRVEFKFATACCCCLNTWFWNIFLYLLYQIIKEDARKAVEEEKTIEDACDALDSGDENDEEEYEAWKVRELRRLKRDKEEREK